MLKNIELNNIIYKKIRHLRELDRVCSRLSAAGSIYITIYSIIVYSIRVLCTCIYMNIKDIQISCFKNGGSYTILLELFHVSGKNDCRRVNI